MRHRIQLTNIYGLLAIAFAFVMSCTALKAGLLRDSDIEAQLNNLAKPLMQAAGLAPGQIQILVVDDPNMNAYVLDHRHVFLHSGLIMAMDSAPMLQSVIAHELAHIRHGHIPQGAGEVGALSTASAIGMAVAAATAASTGNTELGVGIALGTNASTKRVAFGYSRTKETSADRSAMSYLIRAQIPLDGAKALFAKFAGQELLLRERQELYARTHPFSRARMRNVERIIETVPQTPAPNAASDAAQQSFERLKIKLIGYLRPASHINTLLKKQDDPFLSAFGAAIMAHRQANFAAAIDHLNSAQNLRPNDPYLWDLRAEILLSQGQELESINAYKRAAQLTPNDALIMAGLGRAYSAAAQNEKAIETLERAITLDPAQGIGLRQLASAYANTGNLAMASVVTAERFALAGRVKDANIHAKRAQNQTTEGSAAWQRALDVLDAINKK